MAAIDAFAFGLVSVNRFFANWQPCDIGLSRKQTYLPMESAKDIIKRFVEELWNARRLDVADQIFSEDCVTHQLRSGVPAEHAHRGPREIKEHVSGWLMSFPDLRFNIEQMIAERDRVVSQLVMEGTHQGNWMGISPTGKRLQIRMITIHRIENGKIVEDWVLVELLGLFQQLGAIPDTAELIHNFAQRADSGSH